MKKPKLAPKRTAFMKDSVKPFPFIDLLAEPSFINFEPTIVSLLHCHQG
jgi:hypothetical protein